MIGRGARKEVTCDRKGCKEGRKGFVEGRNRRREGLRTERVEGRNKTIWGRWWWWWWWGIDRLTWEGVRLVNNVQDGGRFKIELETG
jgi:hypothetical protein